MSTVSYQNLISHILEKVPEIREEYENELQFSRKADATPSSDPLLDSDYLATLGIDIRKEGPGPTIVLENMVVRVIISLADRGSLKRVQEIMTWVEELANSENHRVRNAVAGSICEPLLTTHARKLDNIVPLMGETTKEMCRRQFSRWKLSEYTVRLFDDD